MQRKDNRNIDVGYPCPYLEHQELFFGVSFMVIANEALPSTDESISRKYMSGC